ncbi:hypothetical protein Hypma_002449 [Hypsizygus marmoreus]|uniref:Uncharacterized protein n=1 Tax=Hypsizygus marmoreus TaxID=39966 RepID=A0A369J4A4_HYPMA|nr:hypothetical protein Hypma_002449 [Hypsizygus marmoreus]
MTRDSDVYRIEEEILARTPPFSENHVHAFFIGDTCKYVTTVIVPPNVGSLAAYSVDDLAVEIWVDPEEFYTASVIDMANRSVYLDFIRNEDDKEIRLGNGFTICYKVQKEGGIQNELIYEWSNGYALNGNLLVFKHSESGTLMDVDMDEDLSTVITLVTSAATYGIIQ